MIDSLTYWVGIKGEQLCEGLSFPALYLIISNYFIQAYGLFSCISNYSLRTVGNCFFFSLDSLGVTKSMNFVALVIESRIMLASLFKM